MMIAKIQILYDITNIFIEFSRFDLTTIAAFYQTVPSLLYNSI